MSERVSLEDLFNIDFLDSSTRDEAAIYIDGEIWHAKTHSIAINNFLKSKQQDPTSQKYYRVPFEEIEKLNLPLAFIHIVEENNEEYAFVEINTLFNVDINTVVNALKLDMPNALVFTYNQSDIMVDKVAKSVKKTC